MNFFKQLALIKLFWIKHIPFANAPKLIYKLVHWLSKLVSSNANTKGNLGAKFKGKRVVKSYSAYSKSILFYSILKA